MASPLITLIPSENPAALGQSVTLIATISPSLATGSITFKDGTTTLGTGTLSGGVASLVVSGLAAGTHSLTANYGGDSNDNAANSSATLTIDQPATSTTVSLSSSVNPSRFGTGRDAHGYSFAIRRDG